MISDNVDALLDLMASPDLLDILATAEASETWSATSDYAWVTDKDGNEWLGQFWREMRTGKIDWRPLRKVQL